ncbi:hypothetical protein MKX03_035021 [Papaver bracteatum]|nr:hypothetical protein MKX03_035021 [Papaver bracteatum]
MIGRKMLATSEPFGNVSVVLVGDIRQLPPVFDTPLYTKGGRDLQLTGSFSYSVFDQCVRLDTVFRQSGIEESLFRDALLRLSDGGSNFKDWQLFNTRNYTVMTIEDKNNFKHDLCLFPTKSCAATYNHERLKEIRHPVARINSKNNCDTAKGTNSDEAKGLEKVLFLSKGARVMLRKNLATQYGLVNGSTGTITCIVYEEGKKSPIDMPIAVMVDLDTYTGPKFVKESNLDIIFQCNMSTYSIATNFVLGNHGSQKSRFDT